MARKRELADRGEGRTMTDATNRMTRPGAGPRSSALYFQGIPTNHYINFNSETGRVEIAKTMPRGIDDELVKDFPDEASARAWAEAEFHAGRLE